MEGFEPSTTCSQSRYATSALHPYSPETIAVSLFEGPSVLPQPPVHDYTANKRAPSAPVYPFDRLTGLAGDLTWHHRAKGPPPVRVFDSPSVSRTNGSEGRPPTNYLDDGGGLYSCAIGEPLKGLGHPFCLRNVDECPARPPFTPIVDEQPAPFLIRVGENTDMPAY